MLREARAHVTYPIGGAIASAVAGLVFGAPPAVYLAAAGAMALVAVGLWHTSYAIARRFPTDDEIYQEVEWHQNIIARNIAEAEVKNELVARGQDQPRQPV